MEAYQDTWVSFIDLQHQYVCSKKAQGFGVRRHRRISELIATSTMLQARQRRLQLIIQTTGHACLLGDKRANHQAYIVNAYGLYTKTFVKTIQLRTSYGATIYS